MEFPNQIIINDKDAWNEWHLLMTEGTYSELVKAPERKEGVTHDWDDEDGTERDIEAGIANFKSRQLSIPCVIIGEDLADATQKYYQFIYYIRTSGYFILEVPPLNLKFKLLYQNVSNISKPTKEGKIVWVFTLSLIDDFPFFDLIETAPIKTSENGVLVDGENLITSK